MGNGVILIIRDGWGYRAEKTDNAIAQAKTPSTDFLMKNYPNILIDASGEAVGVPKGYQGNSEVGHMTIGAGRVILQSLKRINDSIKDKSFFDVPEFLDAIQNCKTHGTTMHIAGLLQKEGVHSHMDHLFALLDLCKMNNFKNVKLHLFTDGRDAPVHASLEHIKELEEKIKKIGFGVIATISGRYYAMDRDKRWTRTKRAYECIVSGKSNLQFTDPKESIKESHIAGITDEFIEPRRHEAYAGIQNNDSFIFYNFRTDRTRQLTRAMTDSWFTGWLRKRKKIFFVAMTQYYKNMNTKIAFKEQKLTNLLGSVVADNKLKQLRISETEKYAHVTFFFNGQVEKPNKKEKRILIKSPKVATYDLKPEMSAFKITNKITSEIKKKKHDLIVVNIVNGDMVGHTGEVDAIIKAVEAVDFSVGKIVEHGLKCDYDLLVFADHGNAEDQRPNWKTSHTTNPVPFIVVSNKDELKNVELRKGKGLRDIAPTTLKLLGLSTPPEMTGESIINFKNQNK